MLFPYVSCLCPFFISGSGTQGRRPLAEQLIIVFPTGGRRIVRNHLDAPGKCGIFPDCLPDLLYPQNSGPVIVQAEADMGDGFMVAEEPEQGAWGSAAKGQVMVPPKIFSPGALKG